MSFRIQTGLRDLIQPADKRPTKKAAKVEAGVVSPGVFLLPSPLPLTSFVQFHPAGILQGQGIDPPRGLTTALLKSTLHDSRLLSSKTSKTGSRTASRGTSLDSLLFFGSNCNVICCFESIDYDISIMIFVRRSKSNQTILKSFLSIRNGVQLHSNRIHLGATFFERTLFGHEFPPISSIHRDEIDILCSPSWKAGQLSVTFSLSSSIHDNSESLHGDTNGVQLNSSRKRNLLLHDPNHQGFLNWPRSCCIIRSI